MIGQIWRHSRREIPEEKPAELQGDDERNCFKNSHVASVEDFEKKSNVPEVQEEFEREKWGGKLEFLLSCIGYCVGLGNVWRFPYLAYQNGGGAFLIPYVIMLILCGIPMFNMELSFGQFAGQGPVTAWRAVPLFKGIGFGMMTVSFLVCVYYNVIIGWALFYLFASMQSVLPWTLCDQWWNKESYCPPVNMTTNSSFSTTPSQTTMQTNTTNSSTIRPVSTSEEYWKYRVLRQDQSNGIDDPGEVLWDLCLCLLLAWIIVYLCLIKGVKSSGKVVYFTVSFPYIILIILLIKGCTLDGAIDGIIFYVKPEWSKLLESEVWSAAATQIFFSLNVAYGGLITFASYNKFNHNILRDTFIVTIGNCTTSVFSGFVIFSVIGHMAHELKLQVSQVIDQGPGLAFIAYPQAVALLPLLQLWSILFFFMLLTVGLDSQFALVETVITGFMDEFPKFFKGRKMLLTLAVSIVAYLLGILLVTKGGIHWFNLYNFYSSYHGLLLLALITCLAINWGYGFFFTYRWRFNKDIKLMSGSEPLWYFKAAWMLGTPATLAFLLIYTFIEPSVLTYNDYIYPKWADDLGICMSISCAALVPIYAIGLVIHALLTGKSLSSLIQPDSRWGPSDPTIDYDAMQGEKIHSTLRYANQQSVTDEPPNQQR